MSTNISIKILDRHNLHNKFIQAARPMFSVAHFVRFEYNKSNGKEHHQHRTNAHAEDERIQFFQFAAVVGALFNAIQIDDSLECENNENATEYCEWQQHKTDSDGMISIADKADSSYAVPVDFTRCPNCNSQYKRQRPSNEMEIWTFFVDAISHTSYQFGK